VFDTRPDADIDGEWTLYIEENCLKLPEWVDAVEACLDDGEPIQLVDVDGKKRTLREGDSLAKPVGKMLKNVFEMAREDGVFEKLPLTQKAILFIENVDNEFAWPTGKKPARIRRQPR